MRMFDHIHSADSESLGHLEKDFISALEAFVADGESQRTALFISYTRLCLSLKDDRSSRNWKLQFIFNALIHQLDHAPDGEISEVLYMYTFRDFLEEYSEEPAVQDVMEFHLSNNTLQKLPLIIALRGRYRA